MYNPEVKSGETYMTWDCSLVYAG